MKKLILPFLLVAIGQMGGTSASVPNGDITNADQDIADKIARHTAAWFKYTTVHMNSAHLGQCGDYAVMFIQRYNEQVGKDVARLVTTNNPVPSGTYKVGPKMDVSNIPFFHNKKRSGFYKWNGLPPIKWIGGAQRVGI